MGNIQMNINEKKIDEHLMAYFSMEQSSTTTTTKNELLIRGYHE